jgi:SPW repeat
MSTHFTRRGGTPAGPGARRDEGDHRSRGAADTGEREARFHTGEPDTGDVPVSPLVEEQRDAALRASAPVRDRAAAPPVRDARDRRRVVRTASGLNVVAGVWLIVAPFVLGYGDGDPIWNDVVFGVITAVIALVLVTGLYRAGWLCWTGALVGVWIFASAFWLDATSTAVVNDLVLGCLVVVLALVSVDATVEARSERGRT